MWPRLQEAPPGRQRALSSADPGPAQQAVRAGERVRAQEPQAAAAPAAEHERARGGAGAAADPLREGGRGLGWAGSGRGRGLAGAGREVGGASWGATLTAGTLKRFPKLTEADPAS